MRILLLSGSTRAGSTSTALLRAAAEVAPDGVEPVLWTDLTALAHFDPDDDVAPLPDAVARMRAAIAGAAAVLVCTPEYAGALPGWIVDDACTAIPVQPANVVDGVVAAQAARTAVAGVLRVLAAATRR